MSHSRFRKKLQVFVSSTYEDLKVERQKAVEAILAAGHIPAGMELFASESTEQWNVIERWINASDVFLILLGGRYGSIANGHEKSYVHREFEYAKRLKKPILSLVISDDYLQKKIANNCYTATFGVQNTDERYLELKREIRTTTSDSFNSIDDVGASIARMFANSDSNQFSKCPGWISGKEIKRLEREDAKRYSGIIKASTGTNRDDEFRTLRDRARKEIYIIGAGMGKLARLAEHSLSNQLQRVPIHLFMLNPRFLQEHKDYADLLSSFFGIRNFPDYVQLQFQSLKQFCEEHNNSINCRNKITLATYNVPPTSSMVIIDPETRSGEMVVEFFTYRCGEERPLLTVKKRAGKNMFDSIYDHAKLLFQDCEQVVS